MANEIHLRDEDRLPWLETIEPDEPERGNAARVAAFVVLGLALLAAIVFGVYTLSNDREQPRSGDLIVAEKGDYKVRPDEPGGLKVEGEGDSAIATSAGTKAGGSAIDLTAVPEAPVAATRGAQASVVPTATGTRTIAPVPSSGGRLAATAPMTAPRARVPGAGSGGSLVQLGAFPTEADANAAWSALAKRFGYVATLAKEIQIANVGGRTVHRLRVNAGSATAAADICGRLKVAGEGCFVTS